MDQGLFSKYYPDTPRDLRPVTRLMVFSLVALGLIGGYAVFQEQLIQLDLESHEGNAIKITFDTGDSFLSADWKAVARRAVNQYSRNELGESLELNSRHQYGTSATLTRISKNDAGGCGIFSYAARHFSHTPLGLSEWVADTGTLKFCSRREPFPL